MNNGNKEKYHHGALKGALIGLALKKLDEGGPVQRALAAELGVTKAAPRRHFVTSDDLIAALAAEGFIMLNQRLNAAVKDDLANLGSLYIRFAVEHPQLYKTMFYFPSSQHSRFPELAQFAGEAYRLLVASVQK